MNKRFFLVFPVLLASFLLSGCSFSNITLLPSKNAASSATFLRSDDAGNSWAPKMKIDEKKNIAGIDVLTMAVNPDDPNNIYLGTMSNGLFMTKDAGETWKKVAFADKAYGLVFDLRNPQIMYGSGVFNNRAKIYKREAEDQEWKEIYTEPSEGTTISSLAIDNRNSQILFAGTSGGVIIKSTDGGKTWVNLKVTMNGPSAPITAIGFDSANDAHVFFAAFQSGILETKNGGAIIEDVTKQMDLVGNISSIYTLTTDPFLPGVVYAGTAEGIFRRSADGKWNSLNLIESSKAFPVRAIAINPRRSNEIMYSSAKAIYKSTDNGTKWSTFQLDTNKEISVLKYNQQEPEKIYAGLRGF